MQRTVPTRHFFGILLLACAVLCAGCDKPESDPTTEAGKKAILEQVNIYLSQGRCTDAVAEIRPLYDSKHSDNEVRLIAASAYACVANINFFKMVGDLASNSPYMGPTSFWSLLAKLFPSSSTDFSDRAVEGGLLATEALQAMLVPGAIILPGNYINEGTFNPGATAASDRESEANTYLLFVSIATIGAIENRFGNPNAVTHNNGVFDWGVAAPWGDPTHFSIPREGCWLGSAVVNLVDSIGSVADNATGALKTSLDTLKITMETAIAVPCDTACGGAGLCPKCPLALRDRTSCTGEATDLPSKAAAAIAKMINTTWTDPVP